MKIFNFLFLIFVIIMGTLIPKYIMSDGINDLPLELKDYGIEAINLSRFSLDNPLERIFFVNNLKVESVQIDKRTGKLFTIVKVRGVFGIKYANVFLKGNIYDESGNIFDKKNNFGYTEIYIERYILKEK
ncbi:hypothetical protein BHF71_10525 [Vulcanibacillus modesticaldus]|uniref:Uncharacterized protein n=1 Tax=Vulcanibacillus modesticaldus TaxID=337097 RepID=A0A1D2YTE4_9BACI|nr:hypothetical protein [Vulcanibacillus modesticaldus]OEF98953.1 hypothetical protein BHF71_10525 [Vulcanibacillus modesticaldus]